MNWPAQATPKFFGRLVVCLLTALLATMAIPVSAEQTEELLIGIEPEHNIFDQMARYRALADYLSGQLGIKVNLTIMSRYGEVIERFKTLKLDGAFLTSYTATMAIRELHLVPVVNPVNLNGESTAQGYMFVRKDSGIREVEDMRGGSIVFVDPATLEGYLFPLVYLKRHGITEINSFFNRFDFTGSHVSAIFAVLDGRADIGAAKNTVFDALVAKDPSVLQELDIIARSPQVPEVTLCIRSEISRDLQERIAAVLQLMDKRDDGRQVLTQFKALRFVKSSPADFVKIEEMAQQIRSVTVDHK